MKRNFLKLSIITALLITNTLNAQEDTLDDMSLDDLMSLDSELKADVGSRSGAKNFLQSSAPIDVITYKQIDSSGLTSLTNVLRYFVPGFNSPEPSVSDGSDHVRAFTLRGMSPDQVLVLVNGKRLHTSALLHVNGTIGRGSSNVDLDTIALKSIEKVEILRDGAAAQYGSDAIAGVINIILKGVGHKNSVSAQSGKHKSGDGTKLYADTFVSMPMKYDGFVNLTMSAQKQDETQHAGYDNRVAPPRVTTHIGVPDAQSYSAVLNAEVPTKNEIIFYSNALLNYRDSKASAYFRPPNVNADPIYPAGFLPMIDAKILDYSIAFGVKGELGDGYFWDLSNVYGYNEIKYGVNDSMNYALGASSPTSFNNGGLAFTQNTTNFDLKKNIGSFDLAGGAEYRYENYQIKAGDFESYYNGGSQGFGGYQLENETDSSRESYAFYLDGTYHFSDDFSTELAGRYENFSDFGSTTNLKLALAYNPLEELLLRVSASTGFRAPSLAQSSYSQTSTTVNSGAMSTKGTFTPDDEVSEALGAEDLKPEKSKHLAIGSVYQPIENLSFMVDYFYIHVEDRIMLSGNLAGETQTQKDILVANGVREARFFTNAVNTETQGIDLKLNYKYEFVNSSKLDVGLWYNYNNNRVVKFNTTTTTLENSFEQIDRMENGQPKDSVRFLTNYEISDYNIALNISRYGSYSQVVSDVVYNFDPTITTDLDVNYRVNNSFNVAIGGTNIFDTQAGKFKNLNGTFYGTNGIKQYSMNAPFGYSGAYYYIRATIKF
ncbi:MAG: TonB-dependent receptor [Campylobacterota bacterium]|nr:TonB-dependent receptor [Campylobacterota bacterium]